MKDANRSRGIILNVLLILNVMFYLSPLAIAWDATPPGDSILSENGGGAAFWLYFIIGPISIIIYIILAILKIVFRQRTQQPL